MKGISLHHVGIWTDDAEKMLNFLIEVFGFRLLKRTPIADGTGERIFVDLGNQATFEILTRPQVEPRPDIPPHGGAVKVIGVPHVCLRVEDLPAIEEKIRTLGYRIVLKLPEDDSYEASFELGPVRALWFTGPGGVDFELFEFAEEYPFDELKE